MTYGITRIQWVIFIFGQFLNRYINQPSIPKHAKIPFRITYPKFNLHIAQANLSWQRAVEWVIKFNSLFRTADSMVYVIHISSAIMTYTLESLSSLT